MEAEPVILAVLHTRVLVTQHFMRSLDRNLHTMQMGRLVEQCLLPHLEEPPELNALPTQALTIVRFFLTQVVTNNSLCQQI